MNHSSKHRRFGRLLRLAIATLSMIGLVGCAAKRIPVRGGMPPPPSTAAVPGNSGLAIDHTVRAGESLDQIADNYYGEPGRAEGIAARNGLQAERKLLAGSILKLEFQPDEWAAAQKRAAALEPYNRGVQALAAEKLGEAERLFRVATETEPRLYAAHYNLALVLLKRGRVEAALQMLAELTDARPANTDYRFARGNALFQAARFDEAAEQFARTLAVDPGHKRAVFGLARSFQESGRRAEAIKAWEKYLILDPDSGWARSARENLQKLRHAGSR